MQKIGATGDGKSAVATPDEKKPKEEEEATSRQNRCTATITILPRMHLWLTGARGSVMMAGA